MMLVQLLQHSGLPARQYNADFSDAAMAALSKGDYRVVCISSISPFAVGEARSLCRAAPSWRLSFASHNRSVEFESNRARQRLGPACSGLVSTTLSDALAQIRQLARLLLLRKPSPNPAARKRRRSSPAGRASFSAEKICSGLSCSVLDNAIMPPQRFRHRWFPVRHQIPGSCMSEKPSTTLPATVEKIIKPVFSHGTRTCPDRYPRCRSPLSRGAHREHFDR